MNRTRVVTALVLAPLFTTAVWYGPFLFFLGLIELCVAICFLEYADLAKAKGMDVPRLKGTMASLVIPIAFLGSASLVYIILTAILVSVFAGTVLDRSGGVKRFAFTLAGIMYIGLCFSGALLIRKLPDGEKLFLLICFATWGADIGAYYAGRLWGKRKLAPHISPGKTVEGFIGGLVSASVFSFAFAYIFYPEALGLSAIAAALCGGLIGPLGDLSESSIKRNFGAKDSGTLLPGHGGLLDRADALMMSAPVFYMFLAVKGGLV
ncbi:MAG: phosphatidate cytidylyltransferase [Nitrospinota bacterium]